MGSGDEDLSLLLSLRDRIPETPPTSPSRFPFSDQFPRRCDGGSNMSVFRDAVKSYLDKDPADDLPFAAPNSSKAKGTSSKIEVEKFSGIRLRKCSVSKEEISKLFSDIRFVRLSTLRSLMVDDTISGCWATAGVLVEKGIPKLSSTGKSFCVWKLSTLDEYMVSVFLFGDAHTNNKNERVGTVLALFNLAVRKENTGGGFSLSVFSARQVVKMGIAADYKLCKGKRNDGLACTIAVNKQLGAYCKYHALGTAKRYPTKRTEIAGGNLNSEFWLKKQGIHLFDSRKEGCNSGKDRQALKVLSVDGLKKALSGSNKVTSNRQSQGIRFLSEVTANMKSKKETRQSTYLKNNVTNAVKRSLPVASSESNSIEKKVCRLPTMIELDFVSSDDDHDAMGR